MQTYWALIFSLVFLLTPWKWAALVVPAIYLIALLATALILLVRRRDRAAVLVPLTLPVMHIAWGLGFMVGREILDVDIRD